MHKTRLLVTLTVLFGVPLYAAQALPTTAAVMSGAAFMWYLRIAVALLLVSYVFLQGNSAFRIFTSTAATGIELWAIWMMFGQRIIPLDAFAFVVASTALVAAGYQQREPALAKSSHVAG